MRKKIAEAIPKSLKIGVQCGIGLFIAFIGLKNAGLIVDNPATFVSLGNLSEPATLLALIGIVITIVLVARNVTGAILISVITLTVIGYFVPSGEGSLTATPEGVAAKPDDELLLMELDDMQARTAKTSAAKI